MISSVIHPDTLNEYFCGINSDADYVAPALIDIPDDTRIPKIPLLLLHISFPSLRGLLVARMSSHTGFLEILPMILPLLLLMCLAARCDNIKFHPLGKMADITPLPKESPLTSCTQLRPISLTTVIMRLFERLVYRFELFNICSDYINLDQFAYRKGHNSMG